VQQSQAPWSSRPALWQLNLLSTKPAAAHATQLEDEGKTVVVVFREFQGFGFIAMQEEPRADAVGALRQLRAMGITPVALIGDNPRTAAAIAGGMGLDYRAEMMPQDKLVEIRRMSATGGVMMIGDVI